jgi:transcriptional regulator of acetoin/glycerol metabolism
MVRYIDKSSRDQRLQNALEHLVSGEPVNSATARDAILDSWRRSKFWDLSPDVLDPPYYSSIDHGGRLERAASAVIDHLERTLAGTSMSVILTDRHGRVLVRRSDDRQLLHRLDSINLAPGFSYAEEHVGTNGIGSAIECRNPFFVVGAEHFAHPLAAMSCAGSPIVHPITGRLEGVIDLTCAFENATPLMRALAMQAAGAIQQSLLDQRSLSEKSLLQGFLAANPSSNRPVVGISGDLVMTNAASAQLLNSADHHALRDAATRLARSRRRSSEFLLSSGVSTTLHVRSVDMFNGVILQLTFPKTPNDVPSALKVPSSPTINGLAGRSPAWQRAVQHVDAAYHERKRLLVVGEPGTGKLALLMATHEARRSSLPLLALEPAQLSPNAGAEHEAFIANQIHLGGGTLVFKHLDSLPDDGIPRISDWLTRRRNQPDLWITATFRIAPDVQVPEAIRSHFDCIIELPPLRHRLEDIHDIVSELLKSTSLARHVRVSSEAMHIIATYPWPGNVAELRDALNGALSHRTGDQITVGDLPAAIHRTTRRALSEWESTECDLIVNALREAHGDKGTAARRLGLSRATVYRKLRNYGIDTRTIR